MFSLEKIIDISLLINLNEINVKADPNFKYQRNLEVLRKIYNLSAKTKDIETRRKLYYYCANKRTNKTSEIITEKGGKKN